MIVPNTDVVIGGFASAVHLCLACRLYFLDHFENVAHLGWVEGGARQYACIFLAILQSDVARKTLAEEPISVHMAM